jgi:3-deoxy-D-manno-octulosonic-acid transferase
VLFGPRFQGSRDARLLVACGGGRAVSDASELGVALGGWLGDRTARDEAGARARELVREGLGAAERSVQLVETLLA